MRHASADTETFTIGTRGSALALHQAEHVAALVRAGGHGRDVRLQVLTSEGDIDKSSPLTAIGGRGIFTSSLQRALTSGQIHAAVHSSKDIPSLAATGLTLSAFPGREDTRDAVVSRHGLGLADLPSYPVLGTSSRRRAVQVLALRPDARIVDLRGNIDTRLARSETDQYDAIILAAAGLTRMGWLNRVTELLPVDRFTPAPGQGALAVETRNDDAPTQALIGSIDRPDVRLALAVERAFLRGIGGGCITPLGAHAEIEIVHGMTQVRFHGMLARDDGTALTRIYREWGASDAMEWAFRAAQEMVREVKPNRVFGGGEALRKQFRGMTVIVTGTEAVVDRATEAITARGGTAVNLPTIRIEPPAEPERLADAVVGLRAGRFDRVVLTSASSVRAVAAALGDAGWLEVWTAVVGEATAEALRETGREPDLIAEDARGEGLVAALRSVVGQGDRVLLPQSDRARPVVAEGLTELGARVTAVEAYRTLLVTAADPRHERMMARGEIGAVLLASPSAVEAFIAQAGHLLPALSGAAFVAIGPVTAAAMTAAGLPVHAMPGTPGAVEMVEALSRSLWGAGAERSET